MTSKFHYFSDALARRVDALSKLDVEFFTVDMGEHDIFDVYLNAFSPEDNPVFRERTEHDCSCCKNFLRNMGHVVVVTPDGVESIFDGLDVPAPYDNVAQTLADFVVNRPLKTLFRTPERRFGTRETLELLDDKTTRAWNHFYATVPPRCVDRNAATTIGRYNTNRDVLERSFETLTKDALSTVLDLIDSNSLYRGAEHRPAVQKFLAAATRTITPFQIAIMAKDNQLAHFKNSVIGTLVEDLSKGVDLERAVASFESKVAPQNYRRPTALITPRMVDNALKTLDELGLNDAIERRFARMSDVSVTDVLYADRQARQIMRSKTESLLRDAVATNARQRPLPEGDKITIEDFIANVVPNAQQIELKLANKHVSNFMSLTAPVHADAPPLFEWGNGFAWTYDGDVTDTIKERVKRAGGKVDAPFRISLSWFNYDDLDLHVVEPGGNEICFHNKRGCYGALDVDMNVGAESREAVENVFFNNIMPGTYEVIVDQYNRRETVDVGCEVEIEFLGQTTTLSYPTALKRNTPIAVLKVTKDTILIEPAKGVTSSSRPLEKWGISTQTAQTVSSILLSPNHWGDRQNGNKHFFFILDGCRNPGEARGIYNEFLKPELRDHRKVFEVLGSKSKCPASEDQLSGVGFSSTRRDEVLALVNLSNGGKRCFTITF